MTTLYTDTSTGLKYKDGSQFYIQFNDLSYLIDMGGFRGPPRGSLGGDDKYLFTSNTGWKLPFNGTSYPTDLLVSGSRVVEPNAVLLTIRVVSGNAFNLIDSSGRILVYMPVETGLQISTAASNTATNLNSTFHFIKPSNESYNGVFTFTNNTGAFAELRCNGSTVGLSPYRIETEYTNGVYELPTTQFPNTIFGMVNTGSDNNSRIKLIPLLTNICLNIDNLGNKGIVIGINGQPNSCANTAGNNICINAGNTICNNMYVNYCSQSRNITETICKEWGRVEDQTRRAVSDPIARSYCNNHLRDKTFCGCLNNQDFLEVSQFITDYRGGYAFPLCGSTSCISNDVTAWKLLGEGTSQNCPASNSTLCIQTIAVIDSELDSFTSYQKCTINSNINQILNKK